MVHIGYAAVRLSFADSIDTVVDGMRGTFTESDVTRLRAFLEGIDDLKKKHNVDVHFVQIDQLFDLGGIDLKIGLEVWMSTSC